MAKASDILKIATNEIGVVEKATNNVKYNTEYYGGVVSGNEFDWCVVFLWWCFKKAKASNLFCGGKKTAYVPYVVNYYSQRKLMVSTPKKGDIAIITFNGHGADHIGIVESASGNTVTTIEGNTSGTKGEGVYRKQRKMSEILYLFRPEYDEEISKEVVCKVEMKQIQVGSKGVQVKTLQRILYCWFECPKDFKIDGEFGAITKKYCEKFQGLKGLTKDGICGEKTWYAALNLK